MLAKNADMEENEALEVKVDRSGIKSGRIVKNAPDRLRRVV